MSQLFIDAGSASKCGCRAKNDDAARISSDGNLFAVADGIGGAPMGDVMSIVACNAAVDAYEKEPSLFGAFDAASAATVQVKNLLRPVSSGAGTTLLLAERGEDALKIAWVGDTAAFLLRDGELTYAAMPDNVENSNELGSALGYVEETLPLYAVHTLRKGDRVLLCTDGVWASLTVGRMIELLSFQSNAAWIAQTIAKEAAESGYDNATAIVLVVEDAAQETCEDSEEDARECVELPAVPCTPSYPVVDNL